VLVLYPSQQGMPAVEALESVIRRDLADGSAGHTDLYTEYVDVVRFPEPGYKEVLHDFLRDKYKGEKIDVIVSPWIRGSGEFLSRYRDELFPGAAAVYVQETVQPLEPNSTVIYYNRNYTSSLDFALRLQPNTKRVFVIVGSGAIDKSYLDSARPQLDQFADRVELIYLTDLAMPDLIRKVNDLPPDSILFYLVATADSAGNRFLPPDSLEQISSAANVPMYSWSSTYMGHGIVGGDLFQFELLGDAIADTVLKVLRAGSAQNVPAITTDPRVSQIDWRQLRRFGIDEDRVSIDRSGSE